MSIYPIVFLYGQDTDYIHVKEINDEWTDSQIWDYAQKNRLTIVTKDTDFSDLMMMHEPPPRVIHIKIGNVRMRELHNVVTKLWFDVKNLSKTRKLVRMYSDKIEGIK